MIINYNPPSLSDLRIFDVNLTPEKIKNTGVYFRKFKLNRTLYDRTFNFYNTHEFLWKSVYNDLWDEIQIQGHEIIIEQHYGLDFSLVKRKSESQEFEYTLNIHHEKHSPENSRLRFHCNEIQKEVVRRLKEKGNNYYNCYRLISNLINNHQDDIIEVEVWDSYQNCKDFYYQKMLNTPLITRH